jgi:hypothetical protein
MDEPDTPLPGGTDNVNPPEPDTADDWNYFDPEEDTEETPEPATDEGEEAPTEETEEQSEQPVEPETLELPDGTKIAKDEAIKGYLRQADFSRKTQELAVKRQTVDADIATIEGVMTAFIDHVTSLVPAQPDPAVALRDPAAYVRQKAQYDAAMAQVQKLIELGKAPKEVKAKLETSDQAEKRAEQNRMLAQAVPETATPEGRQKFFERAADAAEEIGFSLDELSGVDDHRMFLALQLAKEGLEARKAKAAAREKVAKAPPVAPRKPGGEGKVTRDVEAVRKFARTPTLRNAVAAWSGD